MIERLLVANGVKTDLETALFDVDHGIRLPARARARPHGPRRAPLDRRRRRARVGPLPQRPLRRSARPLEAGPPPRHARRAEALPPRHDRALPRRPRRLAQHACAGRSHSTRTSRSSGPPSRERHSSETAHRPRGAARDPRRSHAPGCRVGPSARQLHRQPLRAVDLAGNGVYVRYALDLAEIPTFQEGAEVRTPGYAAIARAQPRLRVDGTRVPLTVRLATAPRSGRAPAACRRCASTRSSAPRRRAGSSTFADHATTATGSAGGRSSSPRASGARVVTSSAPATSRSDELRAYPKRPPPLAARHRGARRSTYTPGSSAAPAPAIGGRAGAGAPKRGLRVADPARRPLARRDPALAPDRGLLGRRARPHAGARQGARGRLPRRHEAASRGTRSCSARR